jgi:MFS family permease
MSDALTSTRPLRSRTFAALVDNPDYRRFYFGQGISLTGTWLQGAAVSWLVYRMTRSEWSLGVVDAAGTMPGLLVGLFAGALADRVAPKRMILLMQAAQMALAFVLAGLIGSGTVQIWQLALVLGLTRVSVTFEMPSRQVFLYELVGRDALMNAIALNSGLFNASRVIGPALAGLCLARVGPTACFTLNGASYLAAIAALLSIRTRTRPTGHAAKSPGEILAGFRYLRVDTRVRSLFLLMSFFGVVGMGYMALVPAYATRVLRTDAIGFSILLASIGLGATCGALVIASVGGIRRRERIVLTGMIVFSAALGAAGFVPPRILGISSTGALAAGACCLFVAGFGAIAFYSSTQTLIQTSVPDHLRGRIMGIWMIAFSGSAPLGSLWAGRVAQSYGVALVLFVSAALCLTAAVAVWSADGLGERVEV